MTLRVTLQLREGIIFHDGSVVDAEAVAANLARILSGDVSKFPVRKLLGPLDVVHADGLLVELVYAQPFPGIWRALADGRLGIVSPTSLANLDAAAVGHEGGLVPLVAGSGPYRLRRVEGSWFELERNTDYAWPPGTVHNPGSVFPDAYRIVTHSSGRPEMAVGDERIDILWWPAGRRLPLELEAATADWRAHAFAGTRIIYLTMVMTLEPLGAAPVREALGLIVDRQAVADRLPEATAPTGWPFSREVVPEPAGSARQANIDAGAALQLLELEGWVTSESGRLERDGRMLSIRLATYDPSNAPEYLPLALAVAQEWEAAGIECQVVPARRLTEPGATANAPHVWLLYHDWYDPEIAYYLFHSSEVGKANRAGVTDARLDQLLEQGRVHLDPDLRLQIYQRVADLVLSEALVVPLAQTVGVLRVSPRVVGMSPQPPGSLLPHDLYLRDAPGR